MPARMQLDVQRPAGSPRIWRREDTAEISEAIAEHVRAGIRDGKGADGRGFGIYETGQRAGLQRTLVDTGAFVDGIAPVRLGEREADVTSTADHARYVAGAFPNAIGLSEQATQDVVDLAADRMEQNL